MYKEKGSSSGPPDKRGITQKFFNELVDIVKFNGIDEDNAQDIALEAALEGWKSYDEQRSNTKSMRSWIKYILREQAIPKYFRDQKRVFKGVEIPKAERIDSLSPLEHQSLSHPESHSSLDRAAIYTLMKKSLRNEKQIRFLDAELKARESAKGKQVIKQAAEIAGVSIKEARNLHRQIVSNLKSNPNLIDYMRDR